MKNNRGILILLIILLVNNFMHSGINNPKAYIYNMLVALPGIIIGLSFHEFGHAFTSYKLGDNTPMLDGRVTINPLKHMEPMGFLALIIGGFGWGIPVRIDPSNYKHPRRDEFLVSVSGVFNNFIIAIIFTFILKLILKMVYGNLGLKNNFMLVLIDILTQAVFINIVLAIFNLLPIPPLDGFSIVTEVFNIKKTEKYYMFYEKGFVILLLLLIAGLADKIIQPIVMSVFRMLAHIITL